MITPHSRISECVCEKEIIRQLFSDHFDGAVLIDPKTDEIIKINKYLTGKFEKYMDKGDISYSHNMEKLLSEGVDESSYAALKERAALDTVTKRLASHETYNIDIGLNFGENGAHFSKRFCYRYYNGNKNIILLVCENVSEILSREIDPLTGIFDSTGFHHHVKEWIEEHPGEKFRIQRYNVDRFRDINGIYGYDIGNKILRDFGQYMKHLDTKDSFSAHLNADHFVRFCSAKSPSPEFYRDTFYKAFENYEIKMPITMHMGVYDLCEPECSSYNMSYKALLALQSLKGKHNQFIAYYQKGMMAIEKEQQELLKSVDRALENDEFEMWYQPQVNYREKKIVGAEALLRWQHPEMGLLMPGRFLPILESSGRIADVDSRMIEKTCRQLKKWMDMMPDKNLVVSGNLSREYLYNPDFVKKMINVVERSGIPISIIHFEITESAYMEKPELLIEAVKEMRAKGCVIEMDDFGSAYSSLNTLKDIEIDVLKLDMKFLSGDTKNPRSRIIISSIINMAKALDVPVIAEGVETKEQADMLLGFGCELMQGYYFSKPIPAEEYEKMLKGEKTLNV